MASKREIFISELDKALTDGLILSEEAIDYFNEVKNGKPTKGGMTENGIKILQFMVENIEKYNNIFKSKDIGEGLFMSARSVSGSMRKLLTDGYCTKTGSDPVCYSLTEKGKDFSIDN